jgi:hypothetical protein
MTRQCHYHELVNDSGGKSKFNGEMQSEKNNKN